MERCSGWERLHSERLANGGTMAARSYGWLLTADSHAAWSASGVRRGRGDTMLVVNLALVVYHALDYTHAEDEERLVSPDLERLITEMTACEGEDEEEGCELSEGSETSEGGRADTDDEGIERDSEPAPRRCRRRRRFMLRDVIEVSSFSHLLAWYF
ncbi:unnamed protein product [Plutella xylostella]|uniref:(diamondback moth) hypothetical protein n=1 Tax=Plutella xylostella TaxID=51655 RepID=A0A8S4G6Y1_PLUXY|nr:unnamed protein product [Plutella xylostella]